MTNKSIKWLSWVSRQAFDWPCPLLGKGLVEDIFGLEKASKLDRTGACEDKGIRWSLHSDDPVTEMNPLRCMENAVVRNMWRSDELLSPEERVPVAALCAR